MANVGTIDRGLRFAAGAVLMVAPLVPQAAASLPEWATGNMPLWQRVR